MTAQEVKLWAHLRRLRAQGFHFRRQAPLLGFIVDFACLRHALVIEMDGAQHGSAEGTRRDARRDGLMAARGILVLRFWNNVIDRNLPGVMQRIVETLTDRPPTPALRADPPPPGEGGEFAAGQRHAGRPSDSQRR